MRHARQDYDRIQDPAGLIPDDEPVFLLRGQDVSAPSAVRAYAMAFWSAGGSAEMVTLCRDWADEMDAWQKEHREKVADL